MNANTISKETYVTVQTYLKAVFSTPHLDKVYDEYATQYEYINKSNGYQGHILVTEGLTKLFKEDAGSKLVLDVGSGTGLLGERLSERGFNQIHALDISKASLEEARKKRVYKDFIHSGVTNAPNPDIADNTYDAVVSSGCFVPGHIKMNALEEFCRITKKGGYVVITICDPKFEMDFMNGLNEIMTNCRAELKSMELLPYRLNDVSRNCALTNGYLVVLKVL